MFTFFLDENLHGEKFASVLRNADIPIELHKEHFEPGTEDTVWIPEVASRGWIAVTGDVNTRFNPLEKRAIVISRARMIHVKPGKNATHHVLAVNFVNTYEKICRFLERNDAPCLATLTRPSKEEDRLLNKPGNVNPQKL